MVLTVRKKVRFEVGDGLIRDLFDPTSDPYADISNDSVRLMAPLFSKPFQMSAEEAPGVDFITLTRHIISKLN